MNFLNALRNGYDPLVLGIAAVAGGITILNVLLPNAVTLMAAVISGLACGNLLFDAWKDSR